MMEATASPDTLECNLAVTISNCRLQLDTHHSEHKMQDTILQALAP